MPCLPAYFAHLMLIGGLALGAAQPAFAETGKIEVAVSGTGSVTVQLKGVPLDVALAQVGDKLGFVVERPEGAPMPMLSGRFEGDLDRVMSKLLRQHSHMIVRGGPKSHGIARVLLLGAGGTMVAVNGAGPAPVPAAVAASTPVETAAVSAATPPAPTDVASAEVINRQIQVLATQLSGAQPLAEQPSDPTDIQAMTRALTANASASVSALVASLKAVCVDGSCGQSSKTR